MKNSYQILLLTLALCLVATSAAAKSEPADVSIEGLNLVEKDRRGEIYAATDVDWSQYTQIKLDRATVAFKKNWKRDQNRYDPFKVRDKDVEEIKAKLSDLFNDVFTEELTANSAYTMADSIGPDVMTIVPRIVDLDIAAPDTNSVGRSNSYTQQAGRMTLILEIYDSLSGDLMAKASHRQDAPDYNQMRWTTSVTNTAEARRMLSRWAKELSKRLDEAKTKTSGTE